MNRRERVHVGLIDRDRARWDLIVVEPSKVLEAAAADIVASTRSLFEGGPSGSRIIEEPSDIGDVESHTRGALSSSVAYAFARGRVDVARAAALALSRSLKEKAIIIIVRSDETGKGHYTELESMPGVVHEMDARTALESHPAVMGMKMAEMLKRAEQAGGK